jgi:type 1 fimbriae regulatory protein FimB/type 1 fimbriae regulatory protein FimE
MNTVVRLRPRSNEKRAVARRKPNAELRQREYLAPDEVEKLIKAARGNRWGHRDATMILVTFRHGLRASEVCDLRWTQIKFGRQPTLHVHRIKGSVDSVHPLQLDEVRALHEIERDQDPKSAWVFNTERGSPFSREGFASMVERAGVEAGLGFPIHAHMLRHACGYALANAGHDTRRIQSWMGHKSIQNTVRYTELAPDRFKDFWRR